VANKVIVIGHANVLDFVLEADAAHEGSVVKAILCFVFKVFS
jgi:hypothetical protein